MITFDYIKNIFVANLGMMRGGDRVQTTSPQRHKEHKERPQRTTFFLLSLKSSELIEIDILPENVFCVKGSAIFQR
jgi:hypothetical protein